MQKFFSLLIIASLWWNQRSQQGFSCSLEDTKKLIHSFQSSQMAFEQVLFDIVKKSQKPSENMKGTFLDLSES